VSLLRWVCLVGAAAASGCASAPSYYYTLVPESALGKQTEGPAASYRVEVEPVRVPAQVDRLELVTRLSGGRLSIADNQRWIAPVADELQSALSIELTRQLGESEAASNLPGPVLVLLRMEVERFESTPSRYSLIESTWRLDLRREGWGVQVACHTRAYEQVGGGYPEMVRGYQRAVAHIVREIAGVARESVMATAAAACPMDSGLGTR
jgi:uncharacterized lipoprotein YmbA